MRSISWILAGLCLITVSSTLNATTLTISRYTCPIGKQKFYATSFSSFTSDTTGPDGRPINSMGGHIPYPECPGNRLIIYRDFSLEELKALKVIIRSPEYKLLVKTESSLYRVAWLEKSLNPKSSDYVWHLLRATWYVEGNAEWKARYRQAFLSVAEGISANPSDINSMTLRLRVLNAWREMGQFDRVLNELSAISIDDFANGLPENEEDADRLSQPDQARWLFVRDARRLKKLAIRRDTSVIPIDDLPQWASDEACLVREPKNEFETFFCAQPEVMARTAEDRAYYATNPEELANLRWESTYDGPINGPPQRSFLTKLLDWIF
ncbi:MAG: hypothetical protein ACK41P_00550 [Asticcacaulis sp.]